MLLIDYKQAAQIDKKIQDLHKQLATLYQTRSMLLGTIATPVTADVDIETQAEATDWATDQYTHLQQTWQDYGVQIPSRKQLSSKLRKAQSLFETLQNHPETRGKFELLLVPPTNLYTSTAFDLDEISVKQTRSWKLFAIYNYVNGIKIENQTSLIAHMGLTLANMHMSGLNAYEYGVFLETHSDDVYDQETWSMLPNELTENKEMLYVSYFAGSYRCMSDDALISVGENRFRPALEIK